METNSYLFKTDISNKVEEAVIDIKKRLTLGLYTKGI